MIVEYDYEKTGYSSVLGPKIPTLIIKNLLGSKKKEINALIDTGYDGFLVIPEDTYESLGLHSFEIVEDEIPIVESFSGEKFTLKTANTLIEIESLLDETIIEVDTTPYCREPLIGRQLLEIFTTILDGPAKKLRLEYHKNNE